MESSFELKMDVKLLMIILLNSAFLVGCIRKETPSILRRIELNGINGPAYYYYYDDTKELGLVMKKDYEGSSYDIQIRRDSLKLGDDFFAMVHVWQKEYKVIIFEPTIDTINGTSKPITESYKFHPSREGTYKMKGRIEYDTVVIPFEYKFIVLPKE